jgi:hypothetical protein
MFDNFEPISGVDELFPEVYPGFLLHGSPLSDLTTGAADLEGKWIRSMSGHLKHLMKL